MMCYKVIEMMLKLFCVISQILLATQGAVTPCTKTTKVSSQTTVLTLYTHYYECGDDWWYDWTWTCSKNKYKHKTVTVYMSKTVCCSGYSGSQCLPICNPSCGTNKECSSPNTCTCVDGWKGSDCLTAICTSPCGTNKECSSPNTCTCVDGWKGSDCLTAICTSPCGTNKECSSPNTCTCVDGWKGSDCLTDIDECLEEIHSCEEGCKNTNGSYSCFCEGNKVLANDAEKCLGPVKDIDGISDVNEIALSWLPPANYSDDGELSEYNVTCSTIDNKEVVHHLALFPTNNLTFTSLDPFTSYKCCIEPHWSTNGVGPTKCIEWSTLEDVPADSPQNVRLIAADSVSVLIQWLPPTVPNGIITHYNVYINYTNGTNITTATVKGSYTLYLLDQLDVFQLVGVSISAITGAGEGPMSTYAFNRSGETEPDPVHHLEIDVITNSSVNVSWHPPVSLKGIIISYHIVVRNLAKNNSGLIMNEWILDSHDRNYEIDNLEPFIPYEVDVAAATTVGKGNVVQKTFFTIESVPLIAPLWSLVQRVSATKIQLEWNSLSLELSQGYITKYSIKYSDSVSSCFITGDVMITEVDDEHLLLTELSPKAEYCVSIAASTSMGIGVYSQWTLVQVYERITVYYFFSGIANCKQWRQDNTQNKLKSFSDTLIAAIQSSCQCQITNDYIYSILFLPCFKELAVSKVTTILMAGYDGQELYELIEKWVNTSPAISMDGLELFIERACDNSECLLVVSSSASSSLFTSTTSVRSTNKPISSSNSAFPLIPTVTFSLSVTMTVIVVIIAAIVIVKIRRKKKNRLSDNNTARNLHNIVDLSPNKIDSLHSKQSAVHNPCYEETCTVLKTKIQDDCIQAVDDASSKPLHHVDYDIPFAKESGGNKEAELDTSAFKEPYPQDMRCKMHDSNEHIYEELPR